MGVGLLGVGFLRGEHLRGEHRDVGVGVVGRWFVADSCVYYSEWCRLAAIASSSSSDKTNWRGRRRMPTRVVSAPPHCWEGRWRRQVSHFPCSMHSTVSPHSRARAHSPLLSSLLVVFAFIASQHTHAYTHVHTHLLRRQQHTAPTAYITHFLLADSVYPRLW